MPCHKDAIKHIPSRRLPPKGIKRQGDAQTDTTPSLAAACAAKVALVAVSENYFAILFSPRCTGRKLTPQARFLRWEVCEFPGWSLGVSGLSKATRPFWDWLGLTDDNGRGGGGQQASVPSHTRPRESTRKVLLVGAFGQTALCWCTAQPNH